MKQSGTKVYATIGTLYIGRWSSRLPPLGPSVAIAGRSCWRLFAVHLYLAWAFTRLGTHRDVFALKAVEITPAA
jgi:hypothetical protein